MRQPSSGTPTSLLPPNSLAGKQISAVEEGSPFSIFYFSIQVTICIPRSAFALGPNTLSPDGLGYFLYIWASHVTGSPHCSAPALTCLGGEWHSWDAGTQGVPGSQGLIHLASLAKAHRGCCPFDQPFCLYHREPVLGSLQFQDDTRCCVMFRAAVWSQRCSSP